MNITLRLIVSLVVIVTSITLLSTYLVVNEEKDKQYEELDRRSLLLAESLQEVIEPQLDRKNYSDLKRLVNKFGNRERLLGVSVHGADGMIIAITSSLESATEQVTNIASESLVKGVDVGKTFQIDSKEIHLYSKPILKQEKIQGILTIFHKTAYIHEKLINIWKQTFLRMLAIVVLISLVTLFLIRWGILGPITQTATWLKKIRTGDITQEPTLPRGKLFAPIAKEATRLAKTLSQAKTAAQEEAKLRQTTESLWTPDRLKEFIKSKLEGKSIFMLSNREPYMHVHRGQKIEVIVPAGGLVTALDPVLRFCSGTWIAHGAGDADLEMVDERGRIMVPPEEPSYSLRRVFISKEEEDGYYYGFANEGLWPLCHIAHTRPIFRSEDWFYYKNVNQKFAEVALEELKNIHNPCLLIHDYHFALLAKMIKEKRPDAKIALFWHIPWPNPEVFGICPWQKELLDGMLGADLIGFQTQYHCNNFLDTVDRVLESRISWEKFSVTKEEHTTLIKPFPISIAPADEQFVERTKEKEVSPLEELRIKTKFLGIGVDRLDYTKGIIERLRSIERFLEKYTSYQGEFTFVQIGAPSRIHIKRYHDFLAEVEAEVERINWKFKTKGWRPIIYLKKHHSHEEILPFYKKADFCMVTSLHDGMNLVAKEFVSSRDDSNGALILSCFAGASKELQDALIVNPYDIEQGADAIYHALNMAPEEKTSRMERMRKIVKEHNIYKWTADLVTELTKIGSEYESTIKTV